MHLTGQGLREIYGFCGNPVVFIITCLKSILSRRVRLKQPYTSATQGMIVKNGVDTNASTININYSDYCVL